MTHYGCFRLGCAGLPVARSWVVNGDYTRWYIECSLCGLKTVSNIHGSEESAWADWNRRDYDPVASSVAYLGGLIQANERTIRKLVIKDMIARLEGME